METTAILRGVRLSAQKGRLVADLIRGKQVEQALNTLTFTQKKAAVIIKKVLESAIANAEHNDGADIDELRVTRIFVDKGASLKRMSARAKGRGKSYRKTNLSHHSDRWSIRSKEWDKRLTLQASVYRLPVIGTRVGMRATKTSRKH